MTYDAAADLARLRAICLALPMAAEKSSHGMPAYHIKKGRIFVWFSNDHHGDGRAAIIVKTSGIEEQAQLIEADPELYFRPAYLGPFGWVAMRIDDKAIDWDHVAAKITESWLRIAPPKLAEAFGG